MTENNDKNITPPMKSVNQNITPKPPVKKKKKKKSYKSLMKALTKSSLTEEQRIQKQKERLNKTFVDVNFKKIDVI